jgi:thiamine transport system ATP-binding protein
MINGCEIRLQNVSLKLGEQEFSFDLTVPAGTFAAITGPSGAGKTTLFNVIAGFEIILGGKVLIGGKDMCNVSPAKHPLSVIFQDGNLFAHLDIFTNVALGISPALKLEKKDRDAVSAALARVGLAGFEKRLPGTLSGGEKQRAAFARALVRNRPIMLLDEPFAALDPALRLDMGHLLKELHDERGYTILMITHDPSEAKNLAEMDVRLEQGRVA